MSQANVELVRRGMEAALRKPKPDFSTVNELYHPDHVFISRYDAFEGGSRRGARGYREWRLSIDETVQSEPRLESVTEIDEDRVLAILPTRIQGRSSGLALNEERLGAIVTVRGGKIIRTEVYSSPEEAIDAAGLGE